MALVQFNANKKLLRQVLISFSKQVFGGDLKTVNFGQER